MGGEEDAGSARRLQVHSGEKGKVRGAHASSTPLEAGLSPRQLKQHFRLTAKTLASCPQPPRLPRGKNRVSWQLGLVGERSATLLPPARKGSYWPQELRASTDAVPLWGNLCLPPTPATASLPLGKLPKPHSPHPSKPIHIPSSFLPGIQSEFFINTTRAGPGTLSVTIEGPSKVKMDCQETPEGYKVMYTPMAPGNYLIGVKYGGPNHIVGSPFKAKVTGNNQMALKLLFFLWTVSYQIINRVT